MVCAPISHSHKILTNNYISYINFPTLFISFLPYISICFLPSVNTQEIVFFVKTLDLKEEYVFQLEVL